MASFETVATQLQPFLTAFQSDTPLLPSVCSQPHVIITALMKRFIKPVILDIAQTVPQLLKVKFEDSSNCLMPAKVDVGYVVEKMLKQLLKKKTISVGRTFSFRQQFVAFAKAVIAKIMTQTPIAHSPALKLACLDPCHIDGDCCGATAEFKIVFDHLVKCQHLQMCDVDTLMQQFDIFTERTVHTVTSSCAFQ